MPPSSPQLAAVEHAQHYESGAVGDVAKNIAGVQHIKHQFAELRTPLDRPADQRMFCKHTRPVANFRRDDFRKFGMSRVEESGEAVEVGQRRRRPFESYRLFHRVKPGVPQVSSQRTTSS